MPRFASIVALLAALVLTLGLAACGGDDDDGGGGGVEALSSDFCEDIEYGGEGEADVLIASDLPMQGDSAERSQQMVDAIKIALEDAEWKAGDTNVAFQACDDSLADTGEWDEEQCKSNAEAYAANPDLVGVVGTYNSGCAAVEIPILNEAPDGGVAMVSPGNTLICLTEDSPSCDPEEPDSFYPTDERNYARVVPNDAAQGAGLAQFAQEQGITTPYVLYSGGDDTSRAQAETFIGAAQELGLDISGFDVWDPDAPDFDAVMDRAAEASPDAVVLAGLLEQNGAKLIEDKVSVMGDNESVKLLAFDGFAQQATIDDAGDAAAGMYVSVPGRAPESLEGPGADLVSALESDLGDEPVEQFAPYAAQAADLLLQAIETGSTRSDVIGALIGAEVTDGIVGSFEITKTGDPSVSPISILQAKDVFELAEQTSPEDSTISAARGG